MADVTMLFGFNRSDGINQLLAAYGGDIHRYESGTMTWTGLFQPISTTARGRMRTFLDRGFFVNGEVVKRYDGLTWTNEVVTKKAPVAKYVYTDPNQSILYLGYISYQGQTFASRFWKCDLPKSNDVTYGLEYGADLIQTPNSNVVKSPGAYFKTRNIKIGDPLIIINGANIGEYIVSSVDTETQITLTTNLLYNVAGSQFWVGSNWVNVTTSNNDVMTGFGDNSNQVLVFKNESLHRYDGSSLTKIKGVPGTHSQESVVNIGQYTYYFHRTGIWRYNGYTSELISRPVQDYIDGVSSSNYDSIIAWRVNETTYRVFVGDVSNTDFQLSVTDCFLDFDTISQSWSPGSLPITITASTPFLESNVENTYLGTNNAQVFQDNVGSDDNGVAIPWFAETGWHFPGGESIESEITRIQIYAQAGRGIQFKYKLYGTPFDIDKQWRGLGDIKDYVTEIKLKNRRDIDKIARGINIMLEDSDGLKSPIIEKINVFWRPVTTRSI